MSRNMQRKPMMDQQGMWRTDLGTSDLNRCEWEDGDEAATDENAVASLTDHR